MSDKILIIPIEILYRDLDSRLLITLEAIKRNYTVLLGEHDFSGFRAAGCQSRSSRRFVMEVSWYKSGKFIVFDVKANALISFKRLANHTSGLPRLPNNLKASYSREKTNVYKKEDLDIYIKDSLEINIKTKGKFVYSNLAVGLMGYVLSLSLIHI